MSTSSPSATLLPLLNSPKSNPSKAAAKMKSNDEDELMDRDESRESSPNSPASGTTRRQSVSAGSNKNTRLASTSSMKDDPDQPGAKRPKRTYRACLPCRSRKLKCDLGDPDAPSEGPCKRCRRESRDCVFNPRPVRNFELPRGRHSTTSAATSGAATPDPTGSGLAHQTASTATTSLPPPPSLPTISSQAHPDPLQAYAYPGMIPMPSWGAAPPPPPGLYSPHHAAVALMAGARLPSPSQLAHGASLPPYFIPSPLALPTRQLHPIHPPPPSSSAEMPAPSRTPSYPRPTLISRGSGSSESNLHGSKRPRAEDFEPDPIDEDDEEDELDEDDGMVTNENGEREPVEDVTLEEAVERARGDGSRASSRNRSSNSRVLLSSTLHNPSDALRLLATASSLRSTAAGDGSPSHQTHSPELGGGSSTPSQANGGATLLRRESHNSSAKASPPKESGGWSQWPPIVDRLIFQPEAEILFSFFENEMAPLYPLCPPNLYHPSHLGALTSTESLLLCAMICIAARYSSILLPDRAAQIHSQLAAWIRQEVIFLLDGAASLRHVSTVEALLILTEWPALPLVHRGDALTAKEESEAFTEEGELETQKGLKTSAQYDSMSWTYLGLAVRLAQELGMHNTALYGLDNRDDGIPSWESERVLRTWIYCYNADRHVSVRLGRNAVVQAYMSSSWWEKVTTRASLDVQKRGLNELWAERTLPQGLLAALMGTIQERLYPNKEITRSLLRTGHWESFIRSLDHELRSMASKTKVVLKQGNVESTLLRIEIDYVRLYGNAIALRALQERLRRRVKANDLLFVTPSLLNLQEGPWIIDALAAAQAILQQTVTFLYPKGFLRLCPSRIFQRIMFAATFLFKALAVGVVEHGQSKTIGLLEQAIAALRDASVDAEHISRGFSVLLTRLQAQCIPALLAESGLIDPAQPSYPPSPQRSTIQMNGSIDEATVAATLNGLHSAHDEGVLGEHSIEPEKAPSPTSGMKGATPSGGTAGDSMSVFGETINMHAPTSSNANHHHRPHHQGGTNDHHFAFDLPWQWDPSNSNVDVGKEQDVLFASMWMNQGVDFGGGNQGEQLGLFGTLVGDA